MARVLSYLDAPMWQAVRELYLEDKVVEALNAAEHLGGQDSNDLYAEAEARTNGTQLKLQPWLTLEVIESEAHGRFHEVAALIEAECTRVSERFGWDHREATWVALLPQDVEAPWMPGRWGYFVDKVPYDKICLPNHLIGHPDELARTIRHEFMHGITLNFTAGRAPRWLAEAMSTYAEGRLDAGVWQGVQSGALKWMTPMEVEGLVSTDNREAEKQRAISAAYGQSNLVAHYLSRTYGEQAIGGLLKAMGDESVLGSVQAGLLARTHVDIALRKSFHISEQELFDRAHEWVMEGSPPGSSG